MLYVYNDPFRLTPHYEVLFPRLHWEPLDFEHPRAHAYLLRGRLRLEERDYEQARADLDYAVHEDFKNPGPWLYRGLENLALHRCWNGEDDLDNAAELLERSTADLIQAHRDFIAKTPCAEDLLE
jgi:tetratricopeptide (TPR) repeat protein